MSLFLPSNPMTRRRRDFGCSDTKMSTAAFICQKWVVMRAVVDMRTSSIYFGDGESIWIRDFRGVSVQLLDIGCCFSAHLLANLSTPLFISHFLCPCLSNSCLILEFSSLISDCVFLSYVNSCSSLTNSVSLFLSLSLSISSRSSAWSLLSVSLCAFLPFASQKIALNPSTSTCIMFVSVF